MLPFRLGTTCFVYQADLVTNVRRLADTVDDIELVLYDTDEWGSNFPTLQDIAELRAIAREYNLTYTLHLPLDLMVGHARAYAQAQRAIAVTRELEPIAFITHLDGAVFLQDTRPEMILGWQAMLPRVLEDVVNWVGDPQKVCVENVERWNPDYFAGAVANAGVSRCVDIGHLWKEHRDPVPYLSEHLARTRVVHLHGVGIRDHQSLAHMTPAQLHPVIQLLLERSFRGVLTLEVFDPDDFFSSRAAVLRVVEQTGA